MSSDELEAHARRITVAELRRRREIMRTPRPPMSAEERARRAEADLAAEARARRITPAEVLRRRRPRTAAALAAQL